MKSKFLIKKMKTQIAVTLRYVKTMSPDTLPPCTKHSWEDVPAFQRVCKAKHDNLVEKI